jgi:hypothetical protein
MQWASDGKPKLINGGGGTWDWYVTMTAVEATDESGVVEYYFECYHHEEFNSVWLSFTPGEPCTYTCPISWKQTGLLFRVKARDLYGNETYPSSPWEEAK